VAIFTSSQIYGDLNVSSTIGCKDLYIDRLGSSESNGLFIGNVATDSYLKLNQCGVTVSVTAYTANYIAALINPNNGNQYTIIGAGLNDATNKYGHLKIGTSGASDAGRYAIIQYDDNDNTTGELHLKRPSSTGAIKIIVGGNTGITITENQIILCGGTDGITMATALEAIKISSDGTVAVKTDFVADSNISVSGSIGVGFSTGATSANARVYFGTNSDYIQYDKTAEDLVGALQTTKMINPLNADLTPAEVLFSKDGFMGPQIGWQPEFFDDFSWDSRSEYIFTGAQDAGYPAIQILPSTMQIRGTSTVALPGEYIGIGTEFPLKTQISTARNRYFVMRYRNKSSTLDTPYANGYVEFTTNTGPTWTADQRILFILNTATTRQWYELWIDMYSNTNWSSASTTQYLTGLRVHVDDPLNGAGGENPTLGIDYWGIGHRGYESKFSSSDMYYWGDIQIVGDLSVSGNVNSTAISANTITATTITYPSGIWRKYDLSAGAGLGGTYSSTQAPVMSFGTSFQYAYIICAMVNSGATPAATEYCQAWWHVPDNWVTGTPITFDYRLGVSTNGVAEVRYMDIHWSANTKTFNPESDITNALGREYSTDRILQWVTSGVGVYSQTFRLLTGMTLTTDGTMSGGAIKCGDQIALKWYHQRSILSGAAATTARAMNLRIKYLAED